MSGRAVDRRGRGVSSLYVGLPAGLLTGLLAGPSILGGCSSPTGIANSAVPAPGDASGTAPAVDAGGDAASPAGDSLPMGAISLFNRKSCPSGWAPLLLASGRTLVPTAGDSPPGTMSGQPLDDGEDRPHTHAMPATLNLPAVSYAGVVGEGNHGVARAGSVPMMVTAAAAGAGLPYVQLLVCQKQAAADPAQKPAPTGTLMFFQTAECPAGWGRAGSTQGRILIGLPEGGTPGQKFGGKPLGTEERRTHRHPFAGTLKTSSHGIALLSGGAAGGYAQDGTIPYSGTTEEEDAQLPVLQLLQCQKL